MDLQYFNAEKRMINTKNDLLVALGFEMEI